MVERRLRCVLVRTGVYSVISVLVAQWLERLTGDQKVAGSIPVWSSETFSFALKLE